MSRVQRGLPVLLYVCSMVEQGDGESWFFFFLDTQAGDVTARVLGCYVKLVQLITTLP